METVIFDPSVEQLQVIVATTSLITAPDLADDTQLVKVHEARMFLRDARVKIEKMGKTYRAEALARQKAVIAKERELIAIIEPEEQRLKSLEDAASTLKERAARAALLPMRREMLAKMGAPALADLADEFLLDMNNDQFIGFISERENTEKYQAWLLQIGYVEADKVEWRFETTDGITAAFKLVSTYSDN